MLTRVALSLVLLSCAEAFRVLKQAPESVAPASGELQRSEGDMDLLPSFIETEEEADDVLKIAKNRPPKCTKTEEGMVCKWCVKTASALKCIVCVRTPEGRKCKACIKTKEGETCKPIEKNRPPKCTKTEEGMVCKRCVKRDGALKCRVCVITPEGRKCTVCIKTKEGETCKPIEKPGKPEKPMEAAEETELAESEADDEAAPAELSGEVTTLDTAAEDSGEIACLPVNAQPRHAGECCSKCASCTWGQYISGCWCTSRTSGRGVTCV